MTTGGFNFSFGGGGAPAPTPAASGFNFSFGGGGGAPAPAPATSGFNFGTTPSPAASGFGFGVGTSASAPAPSSGAGNGTPAFGSSSAEASASGGFGGGFNFGGKSATASAPAVGTVVGSASTGNPSGFFMGSIGNSANQTTTLGQSNKSKDGQPISVPNVRAMAWDPTGTAALSLCPLPNTSSSSSSIKNDTQNTTTANLDVFLSHDGTGCPPEETECLIRYLDAREEWLKSNNTNNRRQKGMTGITKLSMEYRAALCDCLMALQNKAAQKGDGMVEGDEDNEGDEENNNLELLNLTYAVSHLAEIFLLPSLSSPSNLVSGDSMYQPRYNSRYEEASSRLDGPPGSLTADTVRYLRLHHAKGVELLDLEEVQDMLNSDQPEYYQFRNPNNTVPGPYEYPYWNLLLHLFRQGELEKAWAILSRSSACRRAEDEAAANDTGGYEQQKLSPDGEGFATLRAILLSAPLPGGRGDEPYCDNSGLDDYLEGDVLESEEEERLAGGGNGGVNDEDMEDGFVEGINQLFLDGVPRKSYLLWESLPRRSDRLRTLRYRRELRRHGQNDDEDDGDSDAILLPETFQSRAAINAFRIWQDTVKDHAFPGGAGTGFLGALFRRFPPLQQLMQLLTGVVHSNIANDPSISWCDRLLMELIYARPDIMPEDIAVRAQVAMKVRGDDQEMFERIVLDVMSGSAGEVVLVMFSLLGGASGAALPATLTSLLCNLLVDAGCISPEKGSASSVINTQTELLVIAAESILSSFAVQEQSDIGVRNVVRLLLPHAPPKRIAIESSEEEEPAFGISYEPRIASMIAEAVGHRIPETDAEARDLMKLCEEVIRLGSVRIADACESLTFSRAVYHGSKADLGRQVVWLLRGMEIQSCWLPTEQSRSLGFASRRYFDALCENVANDLLSVLAANASFAEELEREGEEAVPLAIKAASTVMEAILQDDAMAPVLMGHIQANLLKHVVDIALEGAKGNNCAVGKSIVHCLEETNYTGVVTTLANPKVYLELLHISAAILSKEGKEEGLQVEENDGTTTCAFTIHGMHILMARLTQVMSWDGAMCSHPLLSKKTSPQREKYFGALRLTLCKGLTRAFAPPGSLNGSQKKEASSCSIENLSLEEEVDLMLSPCI